jgi:glycosyltransferase involved in cell wall biosynthesis
MLHRHRPSLVHANSLTMSRIVGPVAKQLNIPNVGHLRDIVKLSAQAVEDLNSHRMLIAVSAATREFHVGQGVDRNKCVVAYNGIDLIEFTPRESTGYLHAERNLPPSARLVATIGQLGLRKGTEVALGAAARVMASEPDVHWLIVGERTSDKEESRKFEAELHRVACEPPLRGRIHFLGNRRDVCRLLNECSLLVHAARQEPLGRVLLEAAASGLPVVATDVGGTREIFPRDAGGAVLVPPDDPAAIAGAVIQLLRNNDHRLALGAAGRRQAEDRFDIRRAAARVVELYNLVLS